MVSLRPRATPRPLSDEDRATVAALASSLLPLSTSQTETLRVLFAGAKP